MDTKISLEDQFSKLHPCFPANTRIGIVGAGPSGLSAAYALAKLGYCNVTVLEKCKNVSGMCESYEIEGKVYDLGGQVLAANSAPVIFQLAKEMGSELVEMDSHKLAVIDSHTGKYQDLDVANDYISILSLTLKLQDEAKASGRIGVHAVSDIASNLTPDFLKRHGIKFVPKSVAYGYTASGWGFVQDMPYAYIQEFARTSMAGKIRRFEGGYMSMWQKLCQSLPFEVLCNTEVLSIERSLLSAHVNIRSADGENKMLEFDKIIVSGAFPFKKGRTYRSSSASKDIESMVMELSEIEKELFCKVETIDYYTTVLKIKGLEHMPMGFYYFGEFMEDPSTIGHPVAMQRFFADSNIFLFWSYGNASDIKGPTVMKLATEVVKNMGGEVEDAILQRRFKYFPHVSSEDMQGGFYAKLEDELQGLQNTYYVGGLMAFELTERNSSYAMALVCKHFANDNSLPSYPYVKRLFPLLSNHEPPTPQELDEFPGIQFPDLNSLDGYLKFWGTHPFTENRTLYTWLNDEGGVATQRTYRDLHNNATLIAHKLLTNNKPLIKPGDRVLLVHLPGLDFVDAFFGCLRARVLPVPLLPPDPLQSGGQALLKIENVSKSCGAVAILSTSFYHSAVRAGFVRNIISLSKRNGKSSARWPDLPWIHTDGLIKNSRKASTESSEDVIDHSEPQPSDLCFLQFTSGSTGEAKGVMITHGGIIHNVKLMRRRYQSTSRTVLVSWLPQYHDMGLIGGLFTALVSGGTAVLFSPVTFIKNPLLWLQTMSRYRATHSAGPNFAFELVIRRLESGKQNTQCFELSSMVFLMVAAEPVRQKTLKKFVELCHPFGLSQMVMAPGYGLAENCVFVSCAYGEGKPILIDWQGRVCCGYINRNSPDVDVRIVDPETGIEHEEHGKEGEVWISCMSSGVGYWGKHELSQITFHNELQTCPGTKFTRTGDLGRIIDGNLFITGRIKDLIIVAGRNIYSADVEKTVETSSDILRPGCCAVIGVPEEILSSKGILVPETTDQVGLVVIAEVREDKRVDKEVVEKIRASVAEEHGVPVASVRLIKPRTICKTTSGKIRRFECLKQFTEGTLSLASEPVSVKRPPLRRSFSTGTCTEGRTPRPQLGKKPLLPQRFEFGMNEIIGFLKELVSEQTGISIDKITETESLVSYGIDSIGVVRASQKLSDFLGVPISAMDIFTATCIEDLASFSEGLVMKSKPQSVTDTLLAMDPEPELRQPDMEITKFRQFGIGFLQIFALIYASTILLLPAYISASAFKNMCFGGNLHLNYLAPLFLAPLAWILQISLTCILISLFGNSFLQGNYLLTPEASICSIDFVKWWALYKVQEVAGKVFAVHLRGTVFLNYWFEMLGARIGSSVIIDTIDITDPSLVSIGDGAVIAEGVLVQSHVVKDGMIHFRPVKIGRKSSIGPYAVIQNGSIVGEESQVLPLQKTEGGKPVYASKRPTKLDKEITERSQEKHLPLHQFMAIYTVGLLSSLSAAIPYFLYILFTKTSPHPQHFTFLCLAGAFHWFPSVIAAYATMFVELPISPSTFAFYVATAYLIHGVLLCSLTALVTRTVSVKQKCLRHRLITACHVRFAKLLSGTEALCVYLRLLGVEIGQHCSIRAINPVVDPGLVSIGDGVHLGDFSRIVTGVYSRDGLHCAKVEIGKNSIIGSQALVLAGSVIQADVVLGALSVAPSNTILQQGGVFVGSQAPVMVKNTLHESDERIDEMDPTYKKIIGNLAGNLAITTMKVKSRYFHRIGVGGRGVMKVFDDLPMFPDHEIFRTGKSFPVIVRHSNSLSADDDARIDARGAALRILSEGPDETPLLDLTLKTGKAFYARTIADFASWLVCGLPAREELVKRAPHIGHAVWGSLRNARSYAELHYYSNFCRLLRFADGRERYVKFKLRPADGSIGEDSGAVVPNGILPPETGAIPRDEHDNRPMLFLAEDFRRRVECPGGLHYVFQMQIQPVPSDEAGRESALDCTRPWDESLFPYINIGEVMLDHNLTTEESERLEFNPFQRCAGVDVIRATSCTSSASIDHGRSLVYEICQRLRNGMPLPAVWRSFLEQSDAKVDLSGCPISAPATKTTKKPTLARSWHQTLWTASAQPVLQTFLPYFILASAVFAPLQVLMSLKSTLPLQLLLPLFWVASGVLASLTCVASKWVLVGKRNEGEVMPMWGFGAFADTAWQAIRTVTGDYFADMTCGSVMFALYMRLMGSDIGGGVYVDSAQAVMNPEMVEIGQGGCVGRDAALFGHIYEGEGGMVRFGKVRVGEGGGVGSRAVVMPGVTVEGGGSLSALSVAMKGEVVRSR